MNIKQMERTEGKGLTLQSMLDRASFEVDRSELINSAGSSTGLDSIYRKDSGFNLGVVSRDYQLVQHNEAIQTVVGALKKTKLPAIKPLSLILSDNGSRMYAHFMIAKQSDIGTTIASNKNVGDLIAPGFVLTNSYDRSLKFGLESFVYRLVCTNGMMAMDKVFSERKRHTTSLSVEAMTERFLESFERFDDTIVPAVAAMTSQIIQPNSLEKELNAVPNWMQEKAIDYLEKGGWVQWDKSEDEPELEIAKQITRWDLLNSFTYVMTHESKDVNPRTVLEVNKVISKRFWAEAA